MYLKKVNVTYINYVYIIIIIISIFFLIFYPLIEKKMEGFSPIDSKFTLEIPAFLEKAKCHPLFCYENRWKPPHMFYKDNINYNPDDYEATNLQCQSCKYGAGCMGFPKKEFNEFKSRN